LNNITNSIIGSYLSRNEDGTLSNPLIEINDLTSSEETIVPSNNNRNLDITKIIIPSR
jgi:hypothetical protein